MINWLSNLFGCNGKTRAEKIEEWDHPEYIKEDWPYLDVPIGKEDKIKLQFQNNLEDYIW